MKMNYILKFISQNMNEIGFIITLIGTVVGVIALWMTIIINKKTNKIQKNIDYFEIRATFKYTKLIAIRKMQIIHEQYRNKGIYKPLEIREVLTELEECKDLYTENFKEVLSELKSELDKEYTGKMPKRIMESVVEIIYRLMRKLENDINVIKVEVGGDN